ncbi:hypothetical protein [Phycicoccus sonneratiae]|uniref:Lipoprotein LpqN n=1 Tax=Phycicoccus sonneratiae TaxID=2807628 RepID=A0ABS2CN04_9MICO|nr:hypothetical protein [Phycicoccus sonneraticus]MBM6401272.1 hypothetical protein [Phycicoccus sonneraticus]
MPVLAHPGPSAPAPPGIRLEVPESWAASPAGDALLRAGGPGASGSVEVVVRHRVQPPQEAADAVVTALATAAGGPSGEVEEPFVVEIGGREWHARNVSWDEAGTPVVEVHLVTSLAATDAVTPVLHVAGRVAGDGLDADYDVLQQVLETLVVEEVAA